MPLLKGRSHKIFLCFRIFSWIIFPKPLKITLGPFRIFPKIHGDICKSRCTNSINDTGGKTFCHPYRWCCWYRWPILGAISDCWHLKVNLKEKLDLCVNSTTQRCKKIIKDCFHLPPVSKTQLVHLELRISQRIFEEKFEMAFMVYSGTWGKLIHEKNLKLEISWHCPFNGKLCKFRLWKVWCDLGTIVSGGKRHFDWRMRTFEDSHM